MLRIVVISLCVANLLLFAVQGNRSSEKEETVAALPVADDPDVPTIHLFNELVGNQDLMSGSRQCYSLGPFHTTEDRDDVRERLREVAASISERESQAVVEKGYWVFMPPYVSLLEANRALLSLQALGLEDVGVIYNGEWKNAVSLGYFLRQGNAQRRKRDLEKRGFEPSMRVRRQFETRYWLDYEQEPGSGMIALDMQNRPNDFMQRALPCPQEGLFDLPQPPAKAVAQAALKEASTSGELAAATPAENIPADRPGKDVAQAALTDESADERPADSTTTTDVPVDPPVEVAVQAAITDEPAGERPKDTDATEKPPGATPGADVGQAAIAEDSVDGEPEGPAATEDMADDLPVEEEAQATMTDEPLTEEPTGREPAGSTTAEEVPVDPPVADMAQAASTNEPAGEESTDIGATGELTDGAPAENAEPGSDPEDEDAPDTGVDEDDEIGPILY